MAAEPSSAIADDAWIRVRGARVHNLRNINVDIPRNQLVVVTGVSGSGKSSLAFDTLFAEGQRRYLETLSARTRQLVSQLERPDVDLITGLPPTVCVDQRIGSVRIRSTLATTTEIFDYLRLLYARAGQAHCPDCGVPVSQQSVEKIVERILDLEDRRKVMILAPLVVGRKGAHRDVFEKICKSGFVRARVDGEVVDAGTPPDLPRSKSHTIEAIVDRIVVKPGIEERLRESVELALKHGEGSCLISELDGDKWRDRLYSSRFCCPECGTSFAPLEPRTFSFNSPYGACVTCRGLGRIVPTDTRTSRHRLRLEMSRLPVCDDCGGARLSPVARAVTFAGTRLQDLVALNIRQAAELIDSLQSESVGGLTELEPEARQVAAGILPEILSRLRFLTDVGLDYLSLDRPTPTLSGGEFQRARLASCLGSGLIGVCHILDEPTIGLHSRDTARLLTVLRELRDQGNSVLVVEHDVEIMRAADWLVDLGPGAGSEGGQLCASGALPMITGDSPTARVLASADGSDLCTSPGDERPVIASFPMLRLSGATRHNLRDCSVEIPIGALTAVTGVSGSGKTSLVMHTLIPALKYALLERPRVDPASQEPMAIVLSDTDLACSELSGFEALDRLVIVDQSPLGRSGRACPATHTGVWDEVRKLFAKTRDARLRDFRARRFSFNAKDGRCAECLGRGAQRIEMNFLPDVFVECPACRGTRFNSQTLSIRYRGQNLSEVLRLRVDEAAAFFENIPRLKKVLDVLIEVGLGYVQLGQSALTLSGGEAQRIRLATELSKSGHDRCLFVLDEPTSGLHPADVQRLLDVLHRLVKQGHSVLVVEHHTDVISSADWMIDLGPEGGSSGGQIVATGTPAEVAHARHPGHTAKALARHFPQVTSTG
jgi:excinuclease ABC subunit A